MKMSDFTCGVKPTEVKRRIQNCYLVTLVGKDVLNDYQLIGVMDDLSEIDKVVYYLRKNYNFEFSEESTGVLDDFGYYEFKIQNSDKDIYLAISKIKHF